MVYICIPSRDEARTLGVLLWKIREVMRGLGRDFHVIVLDDGSRDRTLNLLEKYRRVLPLTVIGEPRPAGYASAKQKLLETASGFARYPKRDAIVVMQADFTDDPDHLAPLLKAFEGGADIVAGNPAPESSPPPLAVRLARRLSRVALRLALGRKSSEPAAAPLHGFRAYRTFVIRRLLREARDRPLLTTDGWAANAELLRLAQPHARRLATVPVQRRYDVRRRPTRVRVLPTVRQVMRLRRAALPVASALAVSAAALATAAAAAPAASQSAVAQPSQLLVLDSLSPESHKVGHVPFGPGEDMRYKVRASIWGGGEAQMTVGAVETVNGHPTYPVEWRIKGGVLGFGIDDRFYSWLDTESLVARRFIKDQRESDRYRAYDFFPEEQLVRRLDRDTTWALPSPLPLDDISFVYYARTLPLEVGKTFSLSRFYKNESNPVVLNVLRRDRIEVPAGTFNTIVVQPIIRSTGLFDEGDEAEIHFSDDERRLVVYMRADLGILYPTLEMSLVSVAQGSAAPAGSASPASVPGKDGGSRP